VGEFDDCSPHGNGKWFFANGAVVESKWVHGVKEGKTTLTRKKKDGTQVTQVVESGNPEDPQNYLDPPVLPLFEMNSVWYE